MNIDKNVLNDNAGESIGTVKSYVQSFKDIESNKRSDAPNPVSYQNKEVPLLTLPETWEEKTEKEIILHYGKRFGCLDFTDLDEKKGKIAVAINRTYKVNLTPDDISKKINKHITQEDMFKDEVTQKKETKPLDIKKKFKIDLLEGNYSYKKGLTPLTEEQLDLCKFINPKDLSFSSDESGFFLSILPGKEKCFDKLFNFSQKEELLYEMFKEQLGNEHKAKKLVLMSRLMNSIEESAKDVKKTPKSPKILKKEEI